MSKGQRKTRVGQVVSNKTLQTVVVAVEWRQRHPLYNKTVRRIANLHVHDAQSVSQLGDVVRVEETRPISKTKRWRVIEVLKHEELPEVKPREIGASLEMAPQNAAPAAGTPEVAPAQATGGQAPSEEVKS